jgi:HK97 family phage portal protein
MAGALMTAADYYSPSRGTSLPSPAGAGFIRPSAGPAVPENVVDGRNWGEAIWMALGGSSSAGSAEAAARVSAVYFCTSIIAIAVGSLPREFRDADQKPVLDFALAELLDERPNMLQTGDEFWSCMLFRAALAGQAFAEPVNSPIGPEIWPLEPRRITMDWDERWFTLTYSHDNKILRYLSPLDVFWISGLADACAKPMTPWKMAKGSIDFALSLEQQGRTFFQNGTRLSGILSTDHKLSDEAIVKLKAGVAAWKNGGTPVLEDGMKYESVVSNNSDSQLQELIKQRTLELARYWHIPRSMIGEDGGGASTHEQEALAFVKYTVRPWARRLEQAVQQRLLTADQRRQVKMHFNLDGMLRGDSATQWRNAVLARTASVMSVNELRTKWFGMPRLDEDWADDATSPLNSNRAADTMSGGMTAPQDRSDARRMLVEDIMDPEA